MNITVLEVTIVPIGTEGPSLSKYVAGALEELEKMDVKYELTPSGTIIEGELEEILDIAKRMHESVFDESIFRVVTTIQIDDRRDKKLTIEGKRKSVEEKLE